MRIRSFKPLPLELNIITFFSTVFICLTFFYIVISLIKQRKTNPIMEEIINWIFIPIKEFDKYLKSFSIIKINYEKMWYTPSVSMYIK